MGYPPDDPGLIGYSRAGGRRSPRVILRRSRSRPPKGLELWKGSEAAMTEMRICHTHSPQPGVRHSEFDMPVVEVLRTRPLFDCFHLH